MAKRPTRQQRLSEARTVLRMRDQFEARLRPRLAAEFSRTARAAASAYPKWQGVLAGHRARLRAILAPVMRSASLAAMRHRRAMFSKGWPAEVEEKLLARPTIDEIEADVLSALAKRMAELVIEISKTTKKRIANAIAEGVSADEGYAAIASRIVEVVPDMSSARAMTIARTEVGQSMAVAEQAEMLATEEALGITIYKIWTASPDDRTRETHAEADGKEARMDSPFTIGGASMMHPSDPDGPLQEVINCRCCLVYDHRAAES